MESESRVRRGTGPAASVPIRFAAQVLRLRATKRGPLRPRGRNDAPSRRRRRLLNSAPSVVVLPGLPVKSRRQGRGELRALAFAERDRDCETLQMLIDNLRAKAHAMRLKEVFHFVFAVEQRNHRLAHPWQGA